MKKKDAFVVFDIGKTNKKMMLFSQSLRILERSVRKIGEKTSRGVVIEDLPAVRDFFLSGLESFARKANIRGISIATHGASFVCINADGHTSSPMIAYTNTPEKKFHRDFFREFGSRRALKKRTCTPDLMSLINVGKGLFFMKRMYPAAFRKMSAVLFYPQYFVWLLTGRCVGEPTHIGCHNYLWDFERKEWSSVARSLGIADKLPSRLMRSWMPAGPVLEPWVKELGIPEDCVVTAGIHDSNASLLPYIVKGGSNFILNSTGTWCVAMKPAKDHRFNSQEMDQTVFYNMDAWGRPVKTVIFMGGSDYGEYLHLLKGCGMSVAPKYSVPAYRRIISDADSFILPSVGKGLGFFPESEPRLVIRGKVIPFKELRLSGKNGGLMGQNKDLIFRLLNLSLALQSVLSFKSLGLKKGMTVYTEGGFRKNKDYNRLMASFFPMSDFRLTGLQEATAFGAAICALAGAEGLSPTDFRELFVIKTQQVKADSLGNMCRYLDKFVDLCQK